MELIAIHDLSLFRERSGSEFVRERDSMTQRSLCRLVHIIAEASFLSPEQSELRDSCAPTMRGRMQGHRSELKFN